MRTLCAPIGERVGGSEPSLSAVMVMVSVITM